METKMDEKMDTQMGVAEPAKTATLMAEYVFDAPR